MLVLVITTGLFIQNLFLGKFEEMFCITNQYDSTRFTNGLTAEKEYDK